MEHENEMRWVRHFTVSNILGTSPAKKYAFAQ